MHKPLIFKVEYIASKIKGAPTFHETEAAMEANLDIDAMINHCVYEDLGLEAWQDGCYVAGHKKPATLEEARASINVNYFISSMIEQGADDE